MNPKVWRGLLEELQRKAETNWLSVIILNGNPLHVRIEGRNTVDWWPATGRGLILGQERKAHLVEIDDLIAMACGDMNHTLDQEFNDMFKE